MRRRAWLGAVVCLAAAVLNSIFILAQDDPFSVTTLVNRGFPLITVAALITGVMGSLVLSRRPGHPIGRLLVLCGVVTGLSLACDAYATWVLFGYGAGPRTVVLAVSWLASALNGFLTMAGFALILLLAPDGHLVSPRWRVVVVVAVLGCLLLSLPPFLEPAVYAGTDPMPVGVPARVAIAVGSVLLVVALVAALVSLVRRQLGSSGLVRVQTRWFTLAATTLAGSFAWLVIAQRLLPPGSYALTVLPVFVAVLAFPVAIAVAVLRYRLYNIELIVNRAWLLLGASTFVGSGYVILVALVGTAMAGFWPSLLATSLVACAFQPLRVQVVRLADRLAYGDQAAPYLALADLSQRLGRSPAPDTLLPAVAEACAHATGARVARADLTSAAGSPRISATWPADAVVNEAAAVRLAVHYGGETLGFLWVEPAPGRGLRRRDFLVLTGFGEQSGVAFRNMRLHDDLAGSVAELTEVVRQLEDSQARILRARDEEMTELEGVLAREVTPAMRSVAAELRVLSEGTDAADEDTWDRLTGETKRSLAALRDLSHGLHPGLLEAEGLFTALQAHLRRGGQDQVLTASPDVRGRRFPADRESAAYRCVAEALRVVPALSRVELTLNGEELIIALVGAPLPAALAEHLRDGFEGLDGTLTEDIGADSPCWVATLPA